MINEKLQSKRAFFISSSICLWVLKKNIKELLSRWQKKENNRIFY